MERLTKRQAEFLERIKSDGALVRDFDGFSFIDGTTAHARVVGGLLRKRAITDNGDTLFPDVPSQTLRAVE